MEISRNVAGAAVALAAATLSTMGCGSSPPPTRSQADATAAVRAAEAVGASDTPAAAYHLELANEGIDEAERLVRAGKMRHAELVLARAKADADLATALTQEADTRARAEAARSHIEALQRGQR